MTGQTCVKKSLGFSRYILVSISAYVCDFGLVVTLSEPILHFYTKNAVNSGPNYLRNEGEYFCPLKPESKAKS